MGRKPDSAVWRTQTELTVPGTYRVNKGSGYAYRRGYKGEYVR